MWCSGRCRWRAYRRRRRYLAEHLERRIGELVQAGELAQAERLAGEALPSLRPRLARSLERQRRAMQELQRLEERFRGTFEKWLASRHRRLRGTGHLAPRHQLPPEAAPRGEPLPVVQEERRPHGTVEPIICPTCHRPDFAYALDAQTGWCGVCRRRFPLSACALHFEHGLLGWPHELRRPTRSAQSDSKAHE